jgi:pantoate--beta-alanine ligase
VLGGPKRLVVGGRPEPDPVDLERRTIQHEEQGPPVARPEGRELRAGPAGEARERAPIQRIGPEVTALALNGRSEGPPVGREAHALIATQVADSLFVNPTQFGPNEDLARYPRDSERDRRLLENAGCDLLFAPDPEEMYPTGFETIVDAGSVAAPLEGERRPGHFRGVCTVVLKLLNVVQPHRAYFGQKDAQQLAGLRRLVADLDVPVALVGCPTVREPDWLALSSRNSYLTPEERRAAPVLYRARTAARDRWLAGERDADALRRVMRDILDAEPLARADCVSVAHADTLRELSRADAPALLSMAVFLGKARLIDNVRLE